MVSGIIMPTPSAMLAAMELLSDGWEDCRGIGELVGVDLGGATTDVYSIADGNPANAATVMKGLQEPYAKRSVDGAIHAAAGPELLAECRTLGGCDTGDAKITKAYRLPAQYVIHTPGPVWRDGDDCEEELLADCYKSCLKLAAEHGCRHVTFPSISTGLFRFPLSKAAPIAVRTIKEFCKNKDIFDCIEFVCFDEKTKKAYETALED